MILPENEFSHLKGVNNQPYLDIRTSASHLTKNFLFSWISLFSFLLSYVFYILPIGHFQVAYCLCVKPSLNMRNHSYDLHLQNSFSHKDLFWNRHKDTFIHELLPGAFDSCIRTSKFRAEAELSYIFYWGWKRLLDVLNLHGTLYYNKLKLREHKVNYCDNTSDFASPDESWWCGRYFEIVINDNWRALCKKGVYRILANFHFLQDRANFW